MRREKLLNVIEKSGYNINQLSKELGWHRSNIYNHVAGHTVIGIGKGRALASFLGVTLEVVYGE